MFQKQNSPFVCNKDTLVVLLVSLVTCGWMHSCSREPIMHTLKLTNIFNQLV